MPKSLFFVLYTFLILALLFAGFGSIFSLSEINTKNGLDAKATTELSNSVNPILQPTNTPLKAKTNRSISDTKSSQEPKNESQKKETPVESLVKKSVLEEKKVPIPNSPSSITLPKINLTNLKVSSASINNLDDLYPKMDERPVLENKYAGDFCSDRAYLMGHSEPSYNGQSGAGVRVFERLEEMEVGDVFSATDVNGKSCSYKVQKWDFVRTNSEDGITQAQFDYFFYPPHTSNTLTIQTCQKGSSTVRLIMRAVMI